MDRTYLAHLETFGLATKLAHDDTTFNFVVMIVKVHLDFTRVRFEIVLEALQVAIRFPATIREEHPRIQPAEDAEKRKLLRVQILWHAFHFGQEFEIVIGLNTIKEHATDMSRKKERERERERERAVQ